AHSGRAATEDAGLGAAQAEAPVRMCMPGASGVVQARTRSPSASVTQQSWQAPIWQNPARGAPENSLTRTLSALVRMAVSSVSPSRPSQGFPSSMKGTGAWSWRAMRWKSDMSRVSLLADEDLVEAEDAVEHHHGHRGERDHQRRDGSHHRIDGLGGVHVH